VKKKYWVFILGVIVSLILLGGNYLAFGVWNPLSTPEKLMCNGRLYRISNHAPKAIDDEVPEYWMSHWSWTGKSLYSIQPKGDTIPTVIYLKLINGKYQIYELSGGN
jgi:hypothetical protein